VSVSVSVVGLRLEGRSSNFVPVLIGENVIDVCLGLVCGHE